MIEPVENDKPVEPDQPVSIPTVEMEIPMAQQTVPEQPVTTPTVETKTVREVTREKLERALEKSGNPRSHNVDEILTALEEKGWDIPSTGTDLMVLPNPLVGESVSRWT